MSADNWAICPQCVRDAEKKQAELIAKAHRDYGKVSADEYLELRKQIDAKLELGMTLREDYEQGVYTDGMYSVSYRGGCEVCGFTFAYKYEEKVKLK